MHFARPLFVFVCVLFAFGFFLLAILLLFVVSFCFLFLVSLLAYVYFQVSPLAFDVCLELLFVCDGLCA